jgi:hypothetical protein
MGLLLNVRKFKELWLKAAPGCPGAYPNSHENRSSQGHRSHCQGGRRHSSSRADLRWPQRLRPVRRGNRRYRLWNCTVLASFRPVGCSITSQLDRSAGAPCVARCPFFIGIYLPPLKAAHPPKDSVGSAGRTILGPLCRFPIFGPWADAPTRRLDAIGRVRHMPRTLTQLKSRLAQAMAEADGAEAVLELVRAAVRTYDFDESDVFPAPPEVGAG